MTIKKINRFLLGEPKQNTKLEEKIKNMDSAISKYNLEDDIKVDDIIEEKVYYSTSLSQEVAEKFVFELEQEMLIGRNIKYKVLEIGRDRLILEVIN